MIKSMHYPERVPCFKGCGKTTSHKSSVCLTCRANNNHCKCGKKLQAQTMCSECKDKRRKASGTIFEAYQI